MEKIGRPYFRYDNPADQGRVYDTTGLGTWWQTWRVGPGQWREECLGREKPATAE